MTKKTLDGAESIKHLTVIGAGTMGHGVAQVAAMAGIHVSLYDLNQGAVDKGLSRIAANLDKGVVKNKVTSEDREGALARLSGTTVMKSACEKADMVIEAAPETLELKQSIYRELEQHTAPHAILATNTSSLSIASIAASVSDPSRVVGMHFFNPVHIMKLCEVVVHEKGSPVVTDIARDVAKRMGKTPITVKDAPGFASSRLGLVIGLEAMRMVEAGVASAEDIDTAMKLGYGHPMGPLELTDLVGLDVRLSIAEYLSQEIGEAFSPPQVLKDKVAAGKVGKKSGEGFYRWADGKRES